MKQYSWLIFCYVLCNIVSLSAEWVHKSVLPNGLTVLIRPTNTLQKVSTQLWINVGSKHEKDQQRGLAHWLEHMVFKGTEIMTEEDLLFTTNKLSGTCNAATSYDWTHFYIDLPVQNYREAFPLLADIMQNCTFKQDLMNAEVQVVIQELKMRKDRHNIAVFMNMLASVFPDHPYHYPVIGYKNDLKSLNRATLVHFYKTYYIPSNAVLVIVGNVNPDEALLLVEKHFGSIPAKKKPSLQEYSHQEDLSSQTSTLYRNVQQTNVSLSYVIPGLAKADPYIQHILSLILTNMPQARLRKLLVDDRQLVNGIGSGTFNLFDYDFFRIGFEPKENADINNIIMLIQKEITTIAQKGITDDELTAAMKEVESSFYSFLENNHQQGYAIAQAYLAKNDEQFIFEHYIIKDQELVKTKLKEFATQYLNPWIMHKGLVLPLPESCQSMWDAIQEASNKEDAEILADKQRQSELEGPSYAITVEAKRPLDQLIPKPELLKLNNGLTVYYYHTTTIPKISLILKLKADNLYESEHQQGIFNVFANMLQEETKHYSGERLKKELSLHAINTDISSLSISMDMLQEELPRAFKLLEEMIIHPTFNKDALAKIKSLTIANSKRFWDDAAGITRKLLADYFYADHPFSLSSLGDKQTIESIMQQDLIELYNRYVSPDGAALVIVGNLEGYNIPNLIEKTISHWKGPKVPDITWPRIIPNTTKPTSYHLEREQVLLTLANVSVGYDHSDFYKLLLFNAILNEKLFLLRSESGAFYNISGSLLFWSGKQPGLVKITANVSQTRLDEAEAMIREALPKFISSFNEADLEKGKLRLLNEQADFYSTNESIAETCIYLHKNKFSLDYYKERNDKIEKLSVEEVQEAAARVLDPEKLVTFKVGRVNK